MPPRTPSTRATAARLAASLLLIAGVGWACGRALVGRLAVSARADVDQPVLRFFVQHRAGWLTALAQLLTVLGSSAALVPAVVALGAGWWWLRRSWRNLVVLGAGYLGAELTVTVLKHAVGRARPPRAMAVASFGGSAFPSGHATLAAAVWGTVAVLLAAVVGTRWKGLVWVGGALVAVVVGATRLYLGAHWLTDVVGGWVLGGLWAVALGAATARGR